MFTLAGISRQIGAVQDVVCFWTHYEFSATSARFKISCLACVLRFEFCLKPKQETNLFFVN